MTRGSFEERLDKQGFQKLLDNPRYQSFQDLLDESSYQRLLDMYSITLYSTRRAHVLYRQAVDDEEYLNDYLDASSGRRRRHDSKLCHKERRVINGLVRSGQALSQVGEDYSNDDESRLIEKRWYRFLSEQAFLNEVRCEIAERAELPEEYRNKFKINVDLESTHFYFGGKDESNGDDGHGHYVFDNDEIKGTYLRRPFKEHGFHNVLSVIPRH